MYPPRRPLPLLLLLFGVSFTTDAFGFLPPPGERARKMSWRNCQTVCHLIILQAVLLWKIVVWLFLCVHKTHSCFPHFSCAFPRHRSFGQMYTPPGVELTARAPLCLLWMYETYPVSKNHHVKGFAEFSQITSSQTRTLNAGNPPLPHAKHKYMCS